MAQQMFSLVTLKTMAQDHLKPGSVLREAILSEPDTLPLDVARAKADTYFTLIYQERFKN